MNASGMAGLLLLLGAPLFSPAPPRHDASVSSSKIQIDEGNVVLTFTMSLADLAAVVDLTGERDGLLTAEGFRVLLPRLFKYLSPRLKVSSQGVECSPKLAGGVFPGSLPIPLSSVRTPMGILLRFAASGPPRSIRFRCEAFRDCVADPKHIVDFPDGRSFVLDRNRPEVEWRGGESRSVELGHFLLLGIEHILTGWDHLVFLISLLLVATSFRGVLKFVTAFTLAHSCTLALTAFRLIQLPGALVESMIAASIIYVALENLSAADQKWRWILTFAFGLVHGMGFGGALLEMQLADPALALLGFNLGVEVGQLGVVALMLPVLFLLRRREAFYRRYVVRGGSAAAAGLGLFWLVSRIL
jgi:hydrogenase/urease accessory protein HupE